MFVEVTSEDIAKGKRGRSCECPVALAILRCLCIGNVTVTTRSAWDHDSNRSWDLPKEVTNFIKRFDGGLPVEPFVFTITKP